MKSAISILIAEDEAPQRLAMIDLIKACMPEADIKAICEDGLSALEAMLDVRPDLAFLDIRMPGLSGLEVARAASKKTQIVFTTAYDEHAIKAFETGAVDYLLKPIRQDRLLQTIARVRERYQQQTIPQINDILRALEQKFPPATNKWLKWVTASAGDTIKMIAIEDVLFFQAQDKYIRVVSATEEAVIRTPIKELLQTLDPEVFWQIHRSAIVRVSAIEKIKKDELGHFYAWLKQRKESLPISAAFLSKFKAI